MVSERFREDVSTVPGMVAVGLLCIATGLVVISRSVALIIGFWKFVIGMWVVYLLYRLVVAVEALVDQQTPSE
ncbi:hypothetical protein [Halohasta litchfieldiae]|jgi:hypothetical protein|uniref:Uncharacterized protein n=1 Tax=Halohasta litchfieldiae TaxID=1073996 RepID=A0A1H6XB31_9EURY|nr:hypothetical protein [Halohasta litchfieldiae]SEJ26359.1 hypothetical protein SAMN05444271_13713 [Halohasta litchfieldiae]